MVSGKATENGHSGSNVDTWSESRTPPKLVRCAMLTSYLFTFCLGVSCVTNPFSPAGTDTPAIPRGQFAIVLLPSVYLIDSLLAACPLRWCCMRGIPARNVLKHHIPFLLGMTPSAFLTIFAYHEFRTCLLATNACVTYMAAGCITSINEALWVASSFFPQSWIMDRRYKLAQMSTAFSCLSQFIAIGAVSAAVSCWDLIRYMSKNEHLAVRLCMFIPNFAFFLVVPFVQIPLWHGALRRIRSMLREKAVTGENLEVRLPDEKKKKTSEDTKQE